MGWGVGAGAINPLVFGQVPPSGIETPPPQIQRQGSIITSECQSCLEMKGKQGAAATRKNSPVGGNLEQIKRAAI